MEVVLNETFVSNDGVSFDSREDCINHEFATSTIQMWDDAGQSVSDIDYAYVVKLNTAQDVEVFKSASVNVGVDLISDPAAYYREYDDYFGQEMWRSLDDDIAEFEASLARLKEFKNHIS